MKTSNTYSVVIPWTGGFDSTALLLIALSDPQIEKIGVPHIRWLNNEQQFNQESDARKKILDLLKTHQGYSKICPTTCITDIEYKSTRRTFSIQGAFLATFLAATSWGDYDLMWMGYAPGEESYAASFKSVYEAVNELSSEEEGVYIEDKYRVPKLRFPLIANYNSKHSISETYNDWKCVLESVSTSEHGQPWRTSSVRDATIEWRMKGTTLKELKNIKLCDIYMKHCALRNIDPIWVDRLDSLKNLLKCKADVPSEDVPQNSEYSPEDEASPKCISSTGGYKAGEKDIAEYYPIGKTKKFESHIGQGSIKLTDPKPYLRMSDTELKSTIHSEMSYIFWRFLDPKCPPFGDYQNGKLMRIQQWVNDHILKAKRIHLVSLLTLIRNEFENVC